MTDHFKNIYQNKAEQYDRLVSREDVHGNILSTLMEIAPVSGAEVVEFGAGTGRLTRLLSVVAKHIHAFDESAQMLEVARKTLEMTGTTNWILQVGDNKKLPLPDAYADVVIEGWSFAHAVGWYPETWREEIGGMLAEMQRLLRPNGVMILIETLGTGSKQPQPPTAGLAELYRWWESVHGLSHRWIRTDIQFASVEEADELTRFFFGDELADRIVREKISLLPECTGIWWKKA